jgi:hypothetical protein
MDETCPCRFFVSVGIDAARTTREADHTAGVKPMARRRSCVAHADYDVLSRKVLLKPSTGPLRIQLLPPAARMTSEGESANNSS